MAERVRVLHVLHRLAMGGMENGVVNLINTLPADQYEHRVLSLTDASDFSRRIKDPSVRIDCLHHAGGTPLKQFGAVARILRQFRPHVCHTRNVGTVEVQLIAWLMGVPARIHGEHGWDIGDVDKTNTRLLLLRRLMRPFIHCQIAVSRFTESFLLDQVGVARERVVQVSNGVDTRRFFPRLATESGDASAFRVGAMGRVAAVKNFPLLLCGFARASAASPDFRARARLDLYGGGDGQALVGLAEELGIAGHFHFHPATDQVRLALVGFDLLVVSSLMEGLSNTILEAQACGVPVLATRVGGNVDLVEEGRTGRLFESQAEQALADLLLEGFRNPETLKRLGNNARRHVERHLSLDRMAQSYGAIYRMAIAGSPRYVLGEP